MGWGTYIDGEWSCDCNPPRPSFRRVAKDNRAYYSCPLKFQDKNRCKFFIYEDSPEFAVRTGATPRPPTTPSRPAISHTPGPQVSPHTPTRSRQAQPVQPDYSQQSNETVENDEFDDPELERLMSSVDESVLTPSKRRRVESATTPTPARRDYSDLSNLFTPPESSYELSSAKELSVAGVQQEANTTLRRAVLADDKLDAPVRTYSDAHEMMRVHWKELLDEGSRYIRQLSDILSEKGRRLEEENGDLKRQIATLEEESAALTEQHEEYARQINTVKAAVHTYEDALLL
ncbi:hypothetical protein POJ06DRAFT_260711 [Lipomyces tetrasporus]|uniref:Zinc finger GRF-type domain-containing protein n=1 Tax=Lipomyces tetrasporus TaxID=54092 RepID=A0AAD7QMF0_9ASCO|nr:uncharacterized protein POJ06DRAFT_260711 [Lipomyces tetrasporus]KAJ8098015.1 hypothetical protein POJ06DRAFT_260711 [Lipomyces tetrasporus]